MGKTDPDGDDIYRQQSMVLVPADTPGVIVHRMLSVFGFDDAPHGHGQIEFKNVRVPVENIILGEGRGFEIAQGRLGPGRIHHAMRSIGSAERAVDFFIHRINDPKKVAFGFPLHRNPIMLQRLAECRVEIDAARLVVLNAAIAIDTLGAGRARKEIAEAKIFVPEVLLNTLDKVIQVYGAQGVCQDVPLAQMYAHGRTMKIVDKYIPSFEEQNETNYHVHMDPPKFINCNLPEMRTREPRKLPLLLTNKELPRSRLLRTGAYLPRIFCILERLLEVQRSNDVNIKWYIHGVGVNMADIMINLSSTYDHIWISLKLKVHIHYTKSTRCLLEHRFFIRNTLLVTILCHALRVSTFVL
jgi:hypothetical protein